MGMQPIVGARGAVSRASPVNMQMQKKVISFDQDGLFEGRELSIPKAPVRLLERLEELKLLTSLSEAGLLSSAEEAGVFSKLEAAGAFSKAEALLPLADDLKLLSTVESLLNVERATSSPRAPFSSSVRRRSSPLSLTTTLRSSGSRRSRASLRVQVP